MKSTVTEVPVPDTSVVAPTLAGSYFHDCYQVPVCNRKLTAMEIYLTVVADTPGWVDALMNLRNRAVSLVGLKNLGQLSVVDASKAASAASLPVQDKVIDSLEDMLKRLNRDQEVRKELKRLEKEQPTVAREANAQMGKILKEFEQFLVEQKDLTGRSSLVGKEIHGE